MKNYRVTQDYVKAGFDEDQMVWCDDYQECIDAIVNNQADITYISSYAAEYYLRMYRYSGVSATLTEYSNQACVGVENDPDGILASIMEKTLETISADDVDGIIIASTAEKPKQDLFIEWIYQNPLRSILIAMVIVSLIVVMIALSFFMNRIQRKNMALEKATNARQDFLSRMSHDMRTPMNAIILYSQFGEESTQLQESVEYHNKIHSAGKYLLQLINDSLDLNKIQKGKYELQLEAYCWKEFVKEIENIILPKAKEKGIDFVVKVDCKEPQALLFDRIRLKQIFVNLINNAIKFTPSGGQVVLEISRRAKSDNRELVHFEVRDNGIGMSEKFQQEKLFKAFEQEHVQNDEQRTGLGLSIVKQLVDAMGGSISCDSTVGKGTSFVVELIGETASLQETVRPPVQSMEQVLRGKRILLFEDHPMNKEIAIRLLQKMNIEVESAENGVIGLQMYDESKKNYYDAILMDIRMPEMDGLEAARRIRALPRDDARRIPIIALSANAFEEDMEASRQAGMNEHLAKPIEPDEIYRVLYELISESST